MSLVLLCLLLHVITSHGVTFVINGKQADPCAASLQPASPAQLCTQAQSLPASITVLVQNATDTTLVVEATNLPTGMRVCTVCRMVLGG